MIKKLQQHIIAVMHLYLESKILIRLILETNAKEEKCIFLAQIGVISGQTNSWEV